MQRHNKPLYFDIKLDVATKFISEFDERHITGVKMIKMRRDAIKSGLVKESEVLEFSSLIK